jgi:nicotinate dehydrogenase subunit B
MNAHAAPRPTRRGVLAGAGALIISFSLAERAFAQEGEVAGGGAKPAGPKLPGSLAQAPRLDSWIRIDAESRATVFTGKAELGQGIKTAIVQVAAEELGLRIDHVQLVTADTGRTANEGYTAGSQSMQNSATAIRHAAAQAREILISEAASRHALDAATLRIDDGAVVAGDGRRFGYGELVSETLLAIDAQPQSRFVPSDQFRLIGQSLPRVDIPAKVTGGEAYVQDMRLPGMLHARVVRPAAPGAALEAVDTAAIERMPGVVRVMRDGNFLAVVAEGEFRAVKAMRALAAAARWSTPAALPDPARILETIEASVSETGDVVNRRTGDLAGEKILEAQFSRPYQMHGSIGPSCAVAKFEDDALTVWSHTQGVFPDRAAISEMLGMPPESVRVIHVEGSGCYGHNGADDAAADAAIIARAVPGRPIRVQWMREQEHAWEPYGPAMFGRVRAALDASGRITGWHSGVWSNIHSTRPGPAGALIAARHLASPFPPEEPELEITPSGNGDRNSVPLYDLPNVHVVWNFVRDMPLRVSALRGLGAYLNVFTIECFMDELAAAAGADPVEFRLRHMNDPRARDVITLAAERFGWSGDPLPRGRGRGFAFAKYKNLAAYCATAIEIDVDHETGRITTRRVVSAVDSGEIINPDGIRNQIEGGVLQSLSWTMFEGVAFDRERVLSVDWSSYPIMRFDAVPGVVETHIVPRPGAPFLGTGEASQGPTGAALANTLAHATGARIRDLPLSRERVKAAIGV